MHKIEIPPAIKDDQPKFTHDIPEKASREIFDEYDNPPVRRGRADKEHEFDEWQ